MKTASKLLAALLVLGVLAALVGRWALARYSEQTLPIDEPTIVTIQPGQSLRAVAEMLGGQQLLPHPRWFVIYARLEGRAGSLKAGEYRIIPGTTVRRLLDQLVSGEVLLHALTIVEGWTFRDMMSALHTHPAVHPTLPVDDGAAVMAALGEPSMAAEGLFYPETYHFPRGTTDLTLLRQARTAMQRQLAAAWERRADDLPLEDPYQALILASIVEKETGLDAERPLIAGVFIGRLRRGMRLQSDPTVIYGLGAGYDGDIRSRDLRTDTLYNTYTRGGLPPTPIALPGAASIAAAVRPAETEALFFVATGEGDGSHYFSATLEEHTRAVQRYLARLRQRTVK